MSGFDSVKGAPVLYVRTAIAAAIYAAFLAIVLYVSAELILRFYVHPLMHIIPDFIPSGDASFEQWICTNAKNAFDIFDSIYLSFTSRFLFYFVFIAAPWLCFTFLMNYLCTIRSYYAGRANTYWNYNPMSFTSKAVMTLIIGVLYVVLSYVAQYLVNIFWAKSFFLQMAQESRASSCPTSNWLPYGTNSMSGLIVLAMSAWIGAIAFVALFFMLFSQLFSPLSDDAKYGWEHIEVDSVSNIFGFDRQLVSKHYLLVGLIFAIISAFVIGSIEEKVSEIQNFRLIEVAAETSIKETSDQLEALGATPEITTGQVALISENLSQDFVSLPLTREFFLFLVTYGSLFPAVIWMLSLVVLLFFINFERAKRNQAAVKKELESPKSINDA